MSKPKKSAAQWLGDAFKNSFKAISETLSTEQFNQFVQDAEALQPEDSEETEETEETGSGTETQQETESGDPQNADPSNSGPTNTDLQAQVKALTTRLEAADAALDSEKKAHEGTTAKLTVAQSALSASEAKYSKLRQAVNPMADEDLSNKETNEKQNAGMTKTDIEAREAYKRNNPQA
ncbi:hypothetical protein [Dyadobacter crusticola]|uniref:hypothetical protein n=1 Tax=Dyadobacter crusticola TaxID=292407 RepID=UPI0004E1208C|nr:hypothetical protein [Dyadobacter crusticola]